MQHALRDVMMPAFVAGGFCALVAAGPALASDPTSPPRPTAPARRTRMNRRPAAVKDPKGSPDGGSKEPPTVSLLEGLRSGQLKIEAEGTGDGRMTLSV